MFLAPGNTSAAEILRENTHNQWQRNSITQYSSGSLVRHNNGADHCQGVCCPEWFYYGTNWDGPDFNMISKSRGIVIPLIDWFDWQHYTKTYMYQSMILRAGFYPKYHSYPVWNLNFERWQLTSQVGVLTATLPCFHSTDLSRKNGGRIHSMVTQGAMMSPRFEG